MSYSRSLLQALQVELNLTPAQAEKTLNCVARATLLHAVLKGAVHTPIGKVAMTDHGLQIVEQNTALIAEIADETSLASIGSKLEKFLLGGNSE